MCRAWLALICLCLGQGLFAPNEVVAQSAFDVAVRGEACGGEQIDLDATRVRLRIELASLDPPPTAEELEGLSVTIRCVPEGGILDVEIQRDLARFPAHEFSYDDIPTELRARALALTVAVWVIDDVRPQRAPEPELWQPEPPIGSLSASPSLPPRESAVAQLDIPDAEAALSRARGSRSRLEFTLDVRALVLFAQGPVLAGGGLVELELGSEGVPFAIAVGVELQYTAGALAADSVMLLGSAAAVTARVPFELGSFRVAPQLSTVLGALHLEGTNGLEGLRAGVRTTAMIAIDAGLAVRYPLHPSWNANMVVGLRTYILGADVRSVRGPILIWDEPQPFIQFGLATTWF